MRRLKPELSVDNVSQHRVVHFLKIFGTRGSTVSKRSNNAVKAVLERWSHCGVCSGQILVSSIGVLSRPKGSVTNY